MKFKLLFFLLFLIVTLIIPAEVKAQVTFDCPPNVRIKASDITFNPSSPTPGMPLTVSVKNAPDQIKGKTVYLFVMGPLPTGTDRYQLQFPIDANGNGSVEVNGIKANGDYNVIVSATSDFLTGRCNQQTTLSVAGQVTFEQCGQISLSPANTVFKPGDKVTVNLTGATNYAGKVVYFYFDGQGSTTGASQGNQAVTVNADGTASTVFTISTLSQDQNGAFAVYPDQKQNVPGISPCSNSVSLSVMKPLCGSGTDVAVIDTALGCVPINSITSFTARIFQFSIGITGGIALLMMAFAALKLAFSAGKPEVVKEAKGLFTGAVVGLFFLIFAVLILRFIGVDILGVL